MDERSQAKRQLDVVGDPPRRIEDEDEGPVRSQGEAEAVETLVCVKCGKEYFFAPGEAPATLECEKCQNRVFRSFDSLDASDEAALDFNDSTARDLDPDDPEGEAMPGDVIDLNRD